MGNRDKLLEAACATFGQKGYLATTVDDLLATTGVSPSNFYYHFKSKEELALECLERFFDEIRDELAPVLTDGRSTAAARLEQLRRRFVKRLSDQGCCGGCPLGNLAQELSDSHPAFRRRLAGFFEECMRGFEEIVREGVASGQFRPGVDPRSAAYLLFGAIEGLILLSKSLKDVKPLDRGFRQAVELLKK